MVIHDKLYPEKMNYANWLTAYSMCSQLLCIGYLSQGLMPLSGMRCLLNTPGHPIITTKKLIKLPSIEWKKNTTSNHFLIIFQIQLTLLIFCTLMTRNKCPAKCGFNSK